MKQFPDVDSDAEATASAGSQNEGQKAGDSGVDPAKVAPLPPIDPALVGQAFTAETVDLLKGWVTGTRSPVDVPQPDEITWSISKRATALIDSWLLNKKLATLTACSATNTGIIVIPRERVLHVADSRTNKDSVSANGVVELLGQLFVYGTPKYAPNPGKGYETQLVMFDGTYKASDPAAKGETPCAVLQFEGSPIVHFRLQTAYWTKPYKAANLEGATLKKGK